MQLVNNFKKINEICINFVILHSVMIKKYFYIRPLSALIFIGTFFVFPSGLRAADDNAVTIEASACEQVKLGDARSSVRLKAVDKAAFWAVSDLPQLQSYKKELDVHDFNVMVYAIVDEYIEDMDIRTTHQNKDEICVKVSGRVHPANINRAIDESFEKDSQPENLKDEASVQAAQLSSEVTSELEKAQKEAAARQQQELASKEVLFGENESPAPVTVAPAPESASAVVQNLPSANIVSPETAGNEPSSEPQTEEPLKDDGKLLLYVAPVDFFNNTRSVHYADIVKKWFSADDNFLITENSSLADYIIRPKILRAKVEAINNNSSRMQMVVAVEFKNTSSGKTGTEYQNRFVLYEDNESEQQTARRLMRRLFENACEQVSRQILARRRTDALSDRQPALPSVITPPVAPIVPLTDNG